MTVDSDEYSSGRDPAQSHMPHVESDSTVPADEELTERPVRAYLGDGERLHAVLSNTRVGVERTDGDGTERIEPGGDLGAVAALTDRRVLFVVGQPDGDEVAAVPYVEFADVEARTEMLTRTLVVETDGGVTWEFTVREAAALDDATSHLAAAVPAQFLERAEASRAAAERAAADSDRERRIEALEAAVDAYRRATTVIENPAVETAETRDEAVAAIGDLVDAYLARARSCRSVGNWEAESGDAEDALDRYETAADCFERALELAERYPPGDADAIGTERADLIEKRAAVEVSASASSAPD